MGILSILRTHKTFKSKKWVNNKRVWQSSHTLFLFVVAATKGVELHISTMSLERVGS